MIGLGNSVVKRKIIAPSVPAAPVNVVLPSLTGTGVAGSVITCNKGVWTGVPTPTYEYDFKADGISVQFGLSNEYVTSGPDIDKVITCEVTATNSQGSANATTSNSITVGTAPVNTVAPTVSPSGTQITGTVITASVGTWTGSPTITYEYRWTRNGSPISGATNTTYTIQAADDGTTIRCEVRGTNAYGVSSYVASSNSVSAVNAVAPVNTVAPVISGSTTLGSTLTSTTGTWTGIPTPTYAYQWKRNGSNIGGAINSTYVTTLADSTANITCDVTATNTAGSATAGSNTITLPSYAPVNTVLPVVSGTAVVGQTLSTTNGTWTNSPSTFAYQWFRNATLISGATNSTYTLVQADAGQNIKCTVSAINAGGSTNADSNTLSILATLLDLYPNAAAAYSVRLLRGAHYTSNAIRVRRSNDNAEQNIGFTTAGELNTTALTTFVGSNSGFIVTWYDQSGNANNATQSTPANQPRIVNAGVIILDGSKPCIELTTGVNQFLNINNISFANGITNFNVHNPNNYTTSDYWQFIYLYDGISNAYGLTFSNDPNYRFRNIMFGSQSLRNESIAVNYNRQLTTGYYDGSGATSSDGTLHLNGVSASLLSPQTWSAVKTASMIGWLPSGGSFNYYKGFIQEIIFYRSNQTSNRTLIEGNINTYYGIY